MRRERKSDKGRKGLISSVYLRRVYIYTLLCREEMDDVAERSYKQAREANQPHEGVDQDLSRLRTLKPAYGTTITGEVSILAYAAEF